MATKYVSETTFRISAEPWHFDYGIWMRIRDGDAAAPTISYATNLHLTKIDPNPGVIQEPPAPLFRLRKDECQQLMDELWRVGLRPSEGTGSAGALAATERHLQDMRALAFREMPHAAPLFGQPIPKSNPAMSLQSRD